MTKHKRNFKRFKFDMKTYQERQHIKNEAETVNKYHRKSNLWDNIGVL